MRQDHVIRRAIVSGRLYRSRMTDIALDYLRVFGPGIVATVLAALAVWILRGMISAIFRAVVWVLSGIWHTILNAIKWRIGWY